MKYKNTVSVLLPYLVVVSSANAYLFHTKHQASPALYAKDNQSEPTHAIKVFENAFNPKACEELHYLAMEHNERTSDGSSIFLRPPHNDRPLTPIEHAIDSALVEMGDTTRRVEYWSRDEYMNIDAHADIDETMLEDDGVIRCPLVGHVLYLQIKENLRGPTCVFPNERKGWGLDEDTNGDGKDLVIVPAVEGRILRFSGNAMHAVPKPFHRWLMDRQEEKALREEEKIIGLEDEEDDDYDFYDDEDYEDDIERSVLLFNTWPDGEPGPRGVDGDFASGALPEGIELSEEDASAFLESQEAQILADWEEEYGKHAQHIRCNPFDDWTEVEVETKVRGEGGKDSEAAIGEVNISLMGMESRRLYSKKYAQLRGPKEAMRKALCQESRVSLVRLMKDNIC